MNCSPPGSSVQGMSQPRILEWVAISFSRGSSQPRDQTLVSCIRGRFFTANPPGKPRDRRCRGVNVLKVPRCKCSQVAFCIYENITESWVLTLPPPQYSFLSCRTQPYWFFYIPRTIQKNDLEFSNSQISKKRLRKGSHLKWSRKSMVTQNLMDEYHILLQKPGQRTIN